MTHLLKQNKKEKTIIGKFPINYPPLDLKWYIFKKS